MSQRSIGSKLLEPPAILQLDTVQSKDDIEDEQGTASIPAEGDSPTSSQVADAHHDVQDVAIGKLRIELAVSVTITGNPRDLIEPICKLVCIN